MAESSKKARGIHFPAPSFHFAFNFRFCLLDIFYNRRAYDNDTIGR